MNLRLMNERGLVEAVDILDRIRHGELQNIPNDFLESPLHSDDAGIPFVQPRAGEIRTRWQFGLWLHRRATNGQPLGAIAHRPGLWTWLALRLFDLVCPAIATRRVVKEDARYILSGGDYRKSYRHLVAGPYFLIEAHEEAPGVLKGLLATPPHAPGEVYEQLASRKDLVRSRAAMETATELYWDEAAEQLKRGAAGNGPGSARRLADILMQFELTFDLYAVTAEHLRQMLPAEFERFMGRPA